jgi:hypothetical protein
MKKIASRGGVPKIFSQKIAVYIIAALSSLFISALVSHSAFAAATGGTTVTVQSTDNQTYAKSLNAWASENVALTGLTDGIGGNCNNATDSRTWGKEECINAYIEGYNDRKSNNVDRGDYCDKKGPSKTKCEKAYDGGAYLARIEARGATPDLTATELQAKRDEYCQSKSEDKNTQDVSPKQACEKGYNAGYKGTSKNSACSGLANLEDDCKAAYDAGDALARGQDTSPSSGGASTEDIPCVGGPMGWVLCPIINYMGDGIVAVAGFMDSMMQFKLLLNTDSQNQIQTAVSSFTAVANLILVIAFLVIIFSQTTSLGLSNYGIKKMLPRVIITAILINLSFYICAFAIDISNITGNAIMGFITGQGATNASISSGLEGATHLSGPGTVSTVFSSVIGAAIGVILLIMFLGPLALGIFITFVILVARQVIILFLVLTAPLAFAAWLLPNTESYFKKWKDLFVNMLIIYPMLMAVFGVALFAAKFISQIAETSSVDEGGPVVGDAIAPLISLLVLAIPLLALPFILRQSNAMLGKIGNAAQKYGGQQASGALGKSTRDAAGRKALDLEARAASGRFGGRMEKAGNFRARRKFKLENRGKERDRMQEDALAAAYSGNETARLKAAGVGGAEGAARVGAAVDAIARKRDIEELERAQLPEKYKKQAIATAQATMHSDPGYAADSNEVARAAFEQAKIDRDEAGIRAAFAELSTNSYGVGDVQKLIADNEGDAWMKDAMTKGVSDNFGAFKGKNAAISNWSNNKDGDSISTVAGSDGPYKGLTADQLSSQVKSAAAEAVRSGAVSPEMAASILSSDAQKNLTAETRKIYSDHAATAAQSGGGAQSGTYSTRNSSGTSPGVDVKFNKE